MSTDANDIPARPQAAPSTGASGTGRVDPLAFAQALIRCPSVTPEEGGALDWLEARLAGAGFRCHRLPFSAPGTPDVDNLFARIGAGAPHLCFAGHTDVVPPGDERAWTHPPFAAEVADGVLFGRGAVDMKGAIACFLAATLRHLAQCPEGVPKGSISFLITGDEEGPAINGTAKVLDWMAREGEIPDHCLVGEPTNPKALGEEIKIGRRGSLRAELTLTGRQGHVAYPHLARNPIPAMLAILDAFLAEPLDAGSAHFDPSHLEITSIDVGNRTANVIPAEVRAAIAIRYNDRHRRADLETMLREKARQALQTVEGGDGLAMDLRFTGHGDAFLTTPGRFADTLAEAVQAVTGRVPALTTSGGTSDARFIRKHCPVIEFGLVNETIHAVDERTPVTDLAALTDIYARFLDGYFAAFSEGRPASPPSSAISAG